MNKKNNSIYPPSALPQGNEISHPPHYGGQEDIYECIKIIEAWNLNFHLGNVIKYISRAGKKNPKKTLVDLKKAQWYLNRYIKEYETIKVKKLDT